MPRILKPQLIHLVAPDHQRVLCSNCPVVKALRRRARKRIFANVLVRRTLFNAADEARAGASMQRELLVVRQLVIDAQ